MMKTIRDCYGDALVKYGKDNTAVVVLDADVSSSTKSSIFAERYPERFFNVGIAEANMIGIAAGLASCGKIPFVNSFAVFLTSIGQLAARTFSSYAKLPIKYVGAYGGLSDSFDGPSHHSLEDIAIMRALPNFKVYVASDPVQTDWLVKNAIEDPSPIYLRLTRDVFPAIYGEKEQFQAGKGKVLREGDDATVFACGLMVGQALIAAQMLENEGIQVCVVDMFSIKPLDEAVVVKCAKISGVVVSAEEHNVIGGLGGAISEALCAAGVQVSMGFVGMQDEHAECGPYEKLQNKYGLDADGLAKKVRQTILAKQNDQM